MCMNYMIGNLIASGNFDLPEHKENGHQTAIHSMEQRDQEAIGVVTEQLDV